MNTDTSDRGGRCLTKSDFLDFRKETRVEARIEDMEFIVMDRLFEEGERYVEELERWKAEEKAAGRRAERAPPRKLARESLRERDPW